MTNELREILTNVLEVDVISEHDSSETVPNWDSVRHLSLVMALEDHYGLTFEADEIPNLVSVRNISEAIQRRAAAA